MPFLAPNLNGAAVENLAWFLVAVPDHPDLRRAVTGFYTSLVHAWLWEGAEPDIDLTVDAWHWAISETLEALEMGFPNILLGHIDEVEALLQAIARSSCCSNFAPYDYITPAPAGIPGVDPPPAAWGDETPTTTEEWESWVCGAAHAWVDAQKGVLGEIADTIDSPDIDLTLDIVAIALGLIGLAVTGPFASVLVAGSLALLAFNLIDEQLAVVYDTAAADLETNRTDVVCELVSGTPSSLATVIQGFVTAAAWTTYFQHINYANVIAAVRSGKAGENSLVANPRSDCECVEDPVPSGARIWDYTGTQGEVWYRESDSGAAFVEANDLSAEVDFYRWYDIAGDVTGHLDMALSDTAVAATVDRKITIFSNSDREHTIFVRNAAGATVFANQVVQPGWNATFPCACYIDIEGTGQAGVDGVNGWLKIYIEPAEC